MTAPIIAGSEPTVRVAAPDDAPVLAQFAESSFRDTYERFNRADDMAQYIATAFRPEILHAELADARGFALIAEGSAGVIGYAQVLDADTPHDVATPAMELQRFYVAREYHGSGFAVRLMNETFAVAAVRGAAAIWLGVWEQNARAIAFYTRYGFADIGIKTFLLGSDLQTDRVMWRSVAP
jgi:ribosomal protein S18 acetylase RimI-like enzyme